MQRLVAVKAQFLAHKLGRQPFAYDELSMHRFRQVDPMHRLLSFETKLSTAFWVALSLIACVPMTRLLVAVMVGVPPGHFVRRRLTGIHCGWGKMKQPSGQYVLYIPVEL